jgi:hypothetical protein
MNALTLVELDPSCVPLLHAVAVRLADEGMPVRAIARSVRLPSEDVYEVIRDAIYRGTITEMPKDDWPIGSTRVSRNAFHGTALDNEDALKFACARYFKATRLEAAILAVMLKRSEVTKQQLHLVIEQNRPGENRDETDPKMVDVIICHLRKKLRKVDIVIETIWGIGYSISSAGRERAVAILTDMADQAQVA